MKYVIAMKSGTTFEVEIKDFEKFIQSLQNTVLSGVSQNHYYAEGNVLLCIEDISAVYPLSAQHGVYSGAGGRKHPAKAVKQIRQLLVKHGGK